MRPGGGEAAVRLGFRVQANDSDKLMNAKIRAAKLQKVPYMLVVGNQDVADQEEMESVRG